ncbi:hypothetical protein QMG83_15355 [Salinibacterium sp. G-O1]|uniref:hypothetical protein n=1 Tax=Salinibacterium sp. G-O1 TaxID=3046208 RepID=UPI0024B937D4|nr:hypothetical protein [Salinibacterium sp. G-O1]MDJ0336605.1 hypothetical protein [Salinibacterium sp. G-O1]
MTVIALGILFLARAPVAFRRPQARPAWIASGTGIAALLSIGVIIPIPLADSWLGGVNLLFLLRTALPVIAFWYLREAVAVQVGKESPRRGRAILWALLAVQVLLFIMIPDRGTTNIYFVDEHMIYPAAFLWACVYVAAVIWTSAGIFSQLLPFRGRHFVPFKVGALMTIVGGVALVIHCGLILAGAIEPVSGDLAWVLFNVFFYPGILLTVAGFVAITIRDALVLAQWRLRAARLRRALGSYSGNATRSPVAEALRSSIGLDPVHETYEAAIALRNLQYLDGITLRPEHMRQLAESEGELEQVSAVPGSVRA